MALNNFNSVDGIRRRFLVSCVSMGAHEHAKIMCTCFIKLLDSQTMANKWGLTFRAYFECEPTRANWIHRIKWWKTHWKIANPFVCLIFVVVRLLLLLLFYANLKFRNRFVCLFSASALTEEEKMLFRRKIYSLKTKPLWKCARLQVLGIALMNASATQSTTELTLHTHTQTHILYMYMRREWHRLEWKRGGENEAKKEIKFN